MKNIIINILIAIFCLGITYSAQGQDRENATKTDAKKHEQNTSTNRIPAAERAAEPSRNTNQMNQYGRLPNPKPASPYGVGPPPRVNPRRAAEPVKPTRPVPIAPGTSRNTNQMNQYGRLPNPKPASPYGVGPPPRVNPRRAAEPVKPTRPAPVAAPRTVNPGGAATQGPRTRTNAQTRPLPNPPKRKSKRGSKGKN